MTQSFSKSGRSSLLRRAVRSLTRREVAYHYHPSYELNLAGVPYDPSRGERVLTFLAAEGLIGKNAIRTPDLASIRALRRVHTDSYLQSLHDPETLTTVLGYRLDDRQQEQVLEVFRRTVGATVEATARVLATGKTAVNLGGGFHHARTDSGAGFCVFNDVAVAISRIRDEGFDSNILVVDLDLHDGDGTRQIFADDPTVHTFSIHNHPWGDEEARASTSIALGDDVEDDLYLSTLRDHLPTVIDSVRPRLVFYLAGCDPAFDDALGNWRITPEGMLKRDRFVFSQLRSGPRRLPHVILLAGGYGSAAWRYSARFLGWVASRSQVIEPPSTREITLIHYRQLARQFTLGELGREADRSDDWGLTTEDLYGDLDGVAHETRLLGYFTKHGIELALERMGVLDRLRELGFEKPTLEYELDNPSGQTVYLYADPRRTELLMELRILRDRRTVADMEMLRIEWLLLQNPRTDFKKNRRRLPGQNKPGLGLLFDVCALLVLVCERLELDGLLFVPSHYHLAAQGERILSFLEPEAEARFRAIREAVAQLPLADATRVAETGNLIDHRNGRTVSWKPSPMVLPVSDRLKEIVKGTKYEECAEAARRELDIRLKTEPI